MKFKETADFPPFTNFRRIIKKKYILKTMNPIKNVKRFLVN
jgi:hypothetical protein